MRLLPVTVRFVMRKQNKYIIQQLITGKKKIKYLAVAL